MEANMDYQVSYKEKPPINNDDRVDKLMNVLKNHGSILYKNPDNGLIFTIKGENTSITSYSFIEEGKKTARKGKRKLLLDYSQLHYCLRSVEVLEVNNN